MYENIPTEIESDVVGTGPTVGYLYRINSVEPKYYYNFVVVRDKFFYLAWSRLIVCAQRCEDAVLLYPHTISEDAVLLSVDVEDVVRFAEAELSARLLVLEPRLIGICDRPEVLRLLPEGLAACAELL